MDFRKDRAAIRKSITVGVLEQNDASYRPCVEWISRIFCHINAPIFVPIHCNGTVDQGLCRKRLHAKTFLNADRLESLLETVGRTGRPARPHQQADQHDGDRYKRKRESPNTSA